MPVGNTVPVGVYENATAVQAVVVCDAIVAFGSIDTVKTNAAPVQVPDVGVTLYVAVSATAAELVRLSEMLLPVPDEPTERSGSCAATLHA